MVLLTTTCTKKSDYPECDSTFPNCNTVTEAALLTYTVDNDKQLGVQVAAQIDNDPTNYPILPKAQYPAVYTLVEGLRDKILNGGKVKNKNAFLWEIKIINKPDVLNAFCTPGGYIYVYTGLIKYLDKEDDLAGVMGHEIAHADLRHSAQSIIADKGVSYVIELALGRGTAAQIATLGTQLINLKFSRCDEQQADALSVDYLSGTTYNCKGTASFFAKLLESGQAGGTPEFLSTHPSESSRVQNVNDRGDCIKCNTTPIAGSNYAAVKLSLP
jgi:predicted Zn-dependent protease